METTEKKPKNGFDRLKKKYAELERELNRVKIDIVEKNGTICRQADYITRLQKKIEEKESVILFERSKHEKLVQALFRHMGWLRRLTWNWHNREEE